MSFELSLPTKIVALAGLLVAVAAAGILLLYTGHSTSKTATTPVVPTHVRAPVHTRPVAPKHVARATARFTAGLPTPLLTALRHSKLVVAVVWAKGDPVAADTLAQARAGARSVHAPVVVLDVAGDRVAGQTAAWMKNDIVQPAVLIVRRPGTIAVELPGYADKTAVAQAVLNSR